MKKSIRTTTVVAIVALAAMAGMGLSSCGSSRSQSGERMYVRRHTNSPKVVKSTYRVSGSSRVMGTDQNLRRKTY
ncbi:MAG: hypothetical protein IJ789_07830 [Bacteroidales bacterium]|nr:hypothetical protein [Bacteroidales bacterium]